EKVTGDLEVDVFYDYSVDGSGKFITKRSIAGVSSDRWEQVTVDWLGRTIEKRSPRFGSGDYVESYGYYGSTGNGNAGKLEIHEAPGRAPVYYKYNALGQIEMRGLDYDENEDLEEESTDRI